MSTQIDGDAKEMRETVQPAESAPEKTRAVRYRSTPGQPAGRPCLLLTEPHRAQTVIDAVRAGNYLMTACKLAGLSYDAVNEWYHRGEHDTPNGPFAAFRHSLDAAEAEAEAESIRGVRVAGEKDWKAHMAWLGRRHSGRWAERSREGESGRSGVVINVGIALSPGAEQPQAIEASWVSVPALPDGDS